MAASDAHRFLGFAFAAADLVIEVDPHGAVTFALGAGRGVGAAERDLFGRACTTLFDVGDAALVDAALAGLEPGARRGLLVDRLAHSDLLVVLGALVVLL